MADIHLCMDKKISWELYRSFVTVIQTGSLSAAARALGTTQPTVGRHIAALEKSLKLTLFIRSQGGLLPTEEAKALSGHAAEMANIAESIQRTAANHGSGVHGIVRVTCSEVVGIEIFPIIGTKLQDSYPELKLELVLSNQAQDLLHREADIAVRMFRPKQAQLIVKKAGKIEIGLYASKKYISSHGYPAHPNELEQHRLIGFDKWTDFIRQAIKKLPPGLARELFAFSTDSDLAQLALIRSGAGIGFCQVQLAKRDDRLVRILSEDFIFPMEIWITMHEDLRHSRPCRTVFNALVDGMREYVDYS